VGSVTRCNMSETDRWGSQFLGAAMTVYGLSRWRRGGWILAGFGLLLVRRGVTGHCFSYSLLGISSRGRPGVSAAPATLPSHADRATDHVS
jgi:uncharacterized membrane protein